ncbi:MAG: DUF4157 domain-containing protein [Myxococcota bacterium]|jgi:hypothetical protein|nr:DUF4157 domain-containing protein [Myxococcota bacterium]
MTTESKPVEPSLALIRETLPTDRHEQLWVRKQARLVELSLRAAAERSEIDVASIEQSLASYAQRYQAQAQPAAPTPAQLQQRLSQVQTQRGQLRAALLNPEAVAKLEQDAGRRLPVEQSAARSGVPSRGDLRSDLEALLAKFSGGERQSQLESGAVTLVHVASDEQDNIRSVQATRIAVPANEQAEPSSAQPASQPSVQQQVLEAVSDDAALAQARARLDAMRTRLAARAQEGDVERSELEAEAARVQRAELRAQRSRAQLEQNLGSLQHRQLAQRTIEATKDAARMVVQSRFASLSALCSQLAQGIQLASQADPSLDLLPYHQLLSKLMELPDNAATEQILDASQAMLQAAMQLRSSVLPATLGQQLLSDIETQIDNIQEAARVPHFSLPPAPETPEAEETSFEGRTAFDARLRRFEARRYELGEDSSRLLAAESVLPAELGRTRRAQVEPLRIPDQSPSPVRFQALDYARIQATAEERLRVLQGLQSGVRPSLDLFSQVSGAELARVASQASRLGNAGNLSQQVAGRVAPSKPSLDKLRAQVLAKSLGSLTASSSGRRELGMPTPNRYELDPHAALPLLKRTASIDPDSELSRVYMPALYSIAGMSKGPLRKRAWNGGGDPLAKMDPAGQGIDMVGKNLDLIKVVEKYFGNAGPRGESLSEYGEDPTQGETYQKVVENEFTRATTAVAEWVGSRFQNLADHGSARPRDLFATGQMDPESLISNLKSEAAQIPTAVRDKLAPFVQSDIADVRVYTGPIAAMAASTMGAHAFTLGKHIFFGDAEWDISSPEGLSLLAHEVMHTTHFERAGSVEQKEQEAEALERRVRSAFSPQDNRLLALEDRGRPKGGAALQAAKSATDFGVTEPLPPNKGGFRPTYDPETMIDAITEIIIEWMAESINQEKNRAGGEPS